MIITATAKEIIQLGLTHLFNLNHQFNVGDNIIVKAEFKEKHLPKKWNKMLDKYIYTNIE